MDRLTNPPDVPPEAATIVDTASAVSSRTHTQASLSHPLPLSDHAESVPATSGRPSEDQVLNASTLCPSTTPDPTVSRLLRNKPSFSQSLQTSDGASISLADFTYDLPDAYQVDINCPGSSLAKRYKYPTNYQRTTKYTLLTFVPLNLFSQFRRFYNIYFLLGAIFVLIAPSLEPSSQILPLCIVLVITAIKDGAEDYKRYRQDKHVNNLLYNVVRQGASVPTLSKTIKPGDIIHLTKGQTVPADLVLLSSSAEDGTAFVETMDLDGETSLKRRSAMPFTQPFGTATKMDRVRGRIQCEHPNEKLDQIDGRIHFHRIQFTEKVCLDGGDLGSSEDTSVQPFTTSNVLLRGTHLRNTEEVFGVVLYAGADTKIIRNLKNTGLKFSTMERRLNKLIIAIFVWNAVMLAVSMALSMSDATRHPSNRHEEPWYLGDMSLGPHEIVTQFMVFFVLYTFLIPISIFVSIELVHIVQALFLRWDDRMATIRPHPKKGKQHKSRMHVHNTNLHEDLGAVEYIFSDKTGTLTRNIMTLSKWGVGHQVFDEAGDPGCLGRHIQSLAPGTDEFRRFQRYWQTITLCNSAIPVNEAVSDPEDPEKAASSSQQQLVYESQSPDETALLNAMRGNGFTFMERLKRSLKVSRVPLPAPLERADPDIAPALDDVALEESFELLYTLPFSSDRKRMSVVVRTPDGILLLCKGADNVILPRLSADTPPNLLSHTETAIHQFSLAGLRTLVLAYRTLNAVEFTELQNLMEQAQCAMSHREERLAEVAEWVETDLELLGSTAIEDRLQDEVPETIEYLLRCGIKIWLLTGDKQETAVKIGMSSHLITAQMNLMILNASDISNCQEKLAQFIEIVESRHADEDNALVVNGATLDFLLEDSGLAKQFLALSVKCHSVICCRVTPLQKARVVKLVRKQLKKVTLSIGDGANDVSMIQVAHVGVGIEGMEGAQAVRASDYSFAEFKSLRALIAIHGRYSYLRLANIVFYSFYKNIALITVQFWFGFNNAWSGQTLYLDYYLTLFNTVFTCLPPIAIACFDKDVDERLIGRYPELFRQVKGNVYWNWVVIVNWGLCALWHSGVVYGCLIWVQSSTVVYPNGSGMSYINQEYFVGTVLLVVVTVKICLLTRHWVWPSVISLVVTMAAYVLVLIGLEVFGFVPAGSFADIHRLPAYYLVTVLAVGASLLPDFATKYWVHMYHPEDAVIVRERVHERRKSSVGDTSNQSLTLIAEKGECVD
ncbi:hypothetical protein H4R35_001459 [Dimargaris xerosporica]|nr:hypothetical protein H4R35_001459 [Dimargaris xerosporica]